eukprot:TRINITY_DN43713_c0_g1_i1.p1 TRINITY_DN43713_c0_g1~~TRINITY_DN43713_c0_g1_i1.p1  ORF type:complete len:379 (-),score=72.64 TRINITY_DN43713_c0_g1_i1:85-1221(-)
MNKARAMLDALMGPNRDEKEKDKDKAKEKFKDSEVCKAFLSGFCPMDPAYLGGKRNFKPCQKIHSEIMKGQFDSHPDHAKLLPRYEIEAISSFERAVYECDVRLKDEKKRVREDWGNRRPPLASDALNKIHALKRDARLRFEAAEKMEDDNITEKKRLMTEADDLAKEADALEEVETKKAKDSAIPEEVCEICATVYKGKEGSAGDAAHKQFKVHVAYQEIRDRLAVLKEKAEKAKSEKRDGGDDKQQDEEDGENGQDRRNRGSKSRLREGDASSRDRGRAGSDRQRLSREQDSRSRGRAVKDRESSRRGRDSRSRGDRGDTRDRNSRRAAGRDDRARDSRSRTRRGGRDRDVRSRADNSLSRGRGDRDGEPRSGRAY